MPSAALPSGAASATPAKGLAGSCAGQWAASLATYEDDAPGIITAMLFSLNDGDAPIARPTHATLQTERGQLELTVISSNVEEALGAVRVELELPRLRAGSFKAEFLELSDSSGSWMFGIGDFAIRVEQGPHALDLRQTGGTEEASQAAGGSVQGFEVTLRNLTTKEIEVTGASTQVPGLPIDWRLIERDPLHVVEGVSVPANNEATITIGTEQTAQPVSFVLATPEITYRVAGSPERRQLLDPITFWSGFGEPSDVPAYVAGLPAAACAQRP